MVRHIQMGRLPQLQNGVIDFEFLSFLEANPGLSSQELANVFEQVYPEVEQGVDDQVEEDLSGATGGVQPATTREAGDVGTSRPGLPEIPATGSEAEVAKEIPEGSKQGSEDPGDVRGSQMCLPNGLLRQFEYFLIQEVGRLVGLDKCCSMLFVFVVLRKCVGDRAQRQVGMVKVG